ncbi:glycoside hydrolase family 30 protein [Labilibaculum antarcticum]|nr:hypothetical protein [Labilibaculum antarcticum]
MKSKNVLLISFFILCPLLKGFAQAWGYNNHRIAISSDGNSAPDYAYKWPMGDPDDWGANAAILATLAKLEMQDKLVHFSYNNFIDAPAGPDSENQNKISCDGAIMRWQFDASKFFDVTTQLEQAKTHLAQEMLKSTAEDPLYFIHAGLSEFVYQVVEEVVKMNGLEALSHVKLISHSGFNENEKRRTWHHTWNDIQTLCGHRIQYYKIKDQNACNLRDVLWCSGHDFSPWHWMQVHQDKSIQWLYTRLKAHEMGKADISDVGMLYWLLTGDENGSPEKFKSFLGKGIPYAKQNIAIEAGIRPSVKVYAVKLNKGEASPLFEVEDDTKGKKVGWRNRIYIQPNVTFQTIEGIGGAFNEIGGEALLSLPKKEQEVVMNNLFSKDKAGFTFCRTAIGASDFGIDAYSYSMTPNDFDMEHFSIDRDENYLLPYIKSALAVNPYLTLFASPWSPPAWMKESGKMVGLQKEGNRMKSDPKVQKAYAQYLVKYVQAYAKAGVKIDRICIQNENDADTKYPSCVFPAKEMVAFANKYMSRAFKKNKIKTKIYAGTFRASDQMDLMDFVQCKNRNGIDGIGIQYTETKIINDARTLVPNMKIIHTEGDCYNGKNAAEEAGNRLKEVASYINSGSTNFTYWNMILNETTKSGWDWPQNSLINIDLKNGTVQYNPDYNAMFIISKFIQPGDVRIASVNRSNAHPIITLKSPDGTIKILVQNTAKTDDVFELVIGEKSIKVNVPAQAIAAVILK